MPATSGKPEPETGIANGAKIMEADRKLKPDQKEERGKEE
jgi:hypothetical protein